jgi:Putative Flp pilus-assembly TadE/G-like
MINAHLRRVWRNRSSQSSLRHGRRFHPKSQSREDGSIAIMSFGAVLVICGLLGLGLDLSRVYNRRVELQNIADVAALAAVHELDGTAAGITNAVTKAGEAARRAKYNYWVRAQWSDQAIKFGSTPSPEGEWFDAGSAVGKASELRYVMVDTGGLDPEMWTVDAVFLQVVGGAGTVAVKTEAIAGPSSISVIPFGICAMSNIPVDARTNPGSATPTPAPPNVELLEYGFRRGVGYDLMQLNPGDTSPANFIISPINGALDDATVGAFVCTGRIASREIVNKTVKVGEPFPMASLFDHFNSRFDIFPAGACSPNSAPPDANIKAYDYTVPGSVPWMTPPFSRQGAKRLQTDDSIWGKKLWTIADILPAPSDNDAQSYGVLWSYAKAVPFSSYTAGQPEPASGYTPFPTSAWQTLYNPGRPSVNSYPASTPYAATSGANFLAPGAAHRPGVRGRRVLNVPLLDCPASGGTAKVLAVGKFFMTVPATPTSLYGEFAGIAQPGTLGTDVELY